MNAKIVFFISLLLFFAPSALAQEYDGYIFKTTQELPALLSGDSSVEALDFGENLYTARSIDEIYDFAPEEYIKYIEPNYVAELFEAPNDTYYGLQWSLEAIGIESVWDGLDALEDVTIGIIDSGIMQGHEDFDYQNTILEGYNTISNSTNTEDDVGHGTFVSSLISAVRNNGKGIAGIAENAKIIPLKAFNSKNGLLTDICEAIDLAVNVYNCDIINMSFGFSTNPETLQEAVEAAHAKGVIMIASVGNDAKENSDLSVPIKTLYPAGYDCVIGVGSTDTDDSRSYFSQFNNSVFVTAPGANIAGISHIPDPNGNYYKYGNGTSYAAPLVTAVAAIAKGLDPTMTTQRFQKLLMLTSDDLGEDGYDIYFGHGRLNAHRLFERMTCPMVNIPDKITLSATDGKIEDGSFVPAGTKLKINCSLPDYIEYDIYVNGNPVDSSSYITVGYEDITIELEYNALSIDSFNVLGGYLDVSAQSSQVTIMVCAYNEDGKMIYISSSTHQSDENGYILFPDTSIPQSSLCKVFVFGNLGMLNLIDNNSVKSFNRG